ncbi:Uncharacterised protein [Sphingobacterium daejeonense]|nr:Uncharacterised protein [Sphingobacterium daejeonense]
MDKYNYLYLHDLINDQQKLTIHWLGSRALNTVPNPGGK